MTCSPFRRPALLAAASLLPLLAAAPVQALTTATQTFTLEFTLTGIRDAGSGAPIDQVILDDDVFLNGFANTDSSSSDETGAGMVTTSRMEFFNGSPLAMVDDFFVGVGDSWSTVQTQTATTDGVGLARISEDFGWFLEIDNSSGIEIVFDFAWEYTREIDLTEMGAFDDATVFLDRGEAVFDDFEDPFSEPIFPESDPPATNPLNIGTLPPGFMTTLVDSGTFSFTPDISNGTSSAVTLDWELGVRALDLPEPSAMTLLGVALAWGLRRRR